MSAGGYVHGYSKRERSRLDDQARTLTELLHHDTAYPPGSRVLELGCGVGAQTVILAASSPGADIVSVDISPASVEVARGAALARGLNVTFLVADIFDLPFEAESFDHVFICFVLEHLSQPERALEAAARMLRQGGTLTVIEGDHGSAYCHPSCVESARAIDCLVRLQAEAGGDALIGRRLYPLLEAAGLRSIKVSPRMVYVDGSRPDLEEGFTKLTFTAMVEGVHSKAVSTGMMSEADWQKGIDGLLRTTEGGTFCYTFFKGTAVK